MSDNPIIQALTVDDFKEQFYRDFNFIDTWEAGTYNTNDVVFYSVNRKFYKCLNDGVTSIPTTTADWSLLTPDERVSDLDITHAYGEADTTFNTSIFQNDTDMVLAYLYLSAHYLVNDLNAGGVDSNPTGIVNSKSVGNVSEGYAIPEWQLKSSIYSFYTKSSYGLKYLNMVIPRLKGNMASVEGATNA